MKFEEFGKRVGDIRREYLPGITINRAAQMALMSAIQLTKIESGELNPTIKTIFTMSERWNIPISRFFCEKEKSPQIPKPARVGKQ